MKAEKAEEVGTDQLTKNVLRFPHSNVRNQIVAYESPSNANAGIQLFNSQGWRAVQICMENNQVIVLLESI
jgi:hypothetical protein